MSPNKFIFPIAIVAIVAIGLVFYLQSSRPLTPPISTAVEEQNQIKTELISKESTESSVHPAPTGTITEISDALLSDLNLETTLVTENQNSANFVTDDSQAISDFGHIYSENDF